MVKTNDLNLMYVRDGMNHFNVCRVIRPVYDGYEIIYDNQTIIRRAVDLYPV